MSNCTLRRKLCFCKKQERLFEEKLSTIAQLTPEMLVALGEQGVKTLQDFALFANACASLCIEKRGSIPAIPSYDDIEKRYSNIPFTNTL